MNTTFITFYSDSPNTSYYETSYLKLKQTCDVLKIKLIGESIPFNKEYKNMCLFKPTFVLNKMIELKQNVIWIDADTTLRNLPTDFEDEEHDLIGASHLTGIENIKASPLYFKYCNTIVEFLTSWKKICDYKIENNLHDLDHDILKRHIVPEYKNKLKYKILNNEYCNGYYIDNGVSKSKSKSNTLHEMKKQNFIIG
jgi:hypothetical protein